MNTAPSSWRSPPAFFLLIFVLSLPFLLFAGTPLPGPLNLPISSLMIVCPGLAAAILVWREEGASGVRRLFVRVVDYRKIRAVWYLPIILLMPAIMLLSYGVMLLLGRPLPVDPFVPYLLLPVFVPLFFIAAAFEEIGWMGYAADPLQERRNALLTALILGIVWARRGTPSPGSCSTPRSGRRGRPSRRLRSGSSSSGSIITQTGASLRQPSSTAWSMSPSFRSRTTALTTTRSSPGRSRQWSPSS